MTSSTHMQQCPECFSINGLVFWRELPMNEAIREYARTHIPPAKQYYVSLDTAMGVWGTTIKPEDLADE